MVNRIIEWCLKNRFIVLMFFALIIFWGFISMQRTPVDVHTVPVVEKQVVLDNRI